MGAELMPAGQEFFAQFEEVIYFTVEHYPDCAVLIGDRLVAGGEIDDRESPHSQRDIGYEVGTFVVGASVKELSGHRVRDLHVNRLISILIDDSYYSAHVILQFLVCI